ncbi:hypothetical protein [uncultured Novosphingobium sp.]|uniref:hypothetical protein n=1 Tax=uncultured Novosphingobium sp. TaxID=292277 RepID=UPI0025993EAF|nr:hypothetical protein [uncultured Novosphingobium sp.]
MRRFLIFYAMALAAGMGFGALLGVLWPMTEGFSNPSACDRFSGQYDLTQADAIGAAGNAPTTPAAPSTCSPALGSHQGERASEVTANTSGARHTFGGVPVASIEAVMADRHAQFAHGHTVEDDLRLRPGQLAQAALEKLRGGIDHAQLGYHENARKLLVRAGAFILAELDALEARRAEREQ